MIRKYPDLISLIALALLILILIVLDIQIRFLTLITGGIFILFAPGYAVSSVIFYKGSLEAPAKIALSIGISLALTAVGGILLYATGIPITNLTWAVFGSSTILAASIAAIIRHERENFSGQTGENFKISFSEGILLIISVITIVGSVYIAWNAEENQPYAPFTEFWILPLTEEISEIEIGIRSAERSEMIFKVSIQINGEEIETWDIISLNPNEEFRIEYSLPPKSTPSEVISVYLFNTNDPDEPYRWGQINR